MITQVMTRGKKDARGGQNGNVDERGKKAGRYAGTLPGFFLATREHGIV